MNKQHPFRITLLKLFYLVLMVMYACDIFLDIYFRKTGWLTVLWVVMFLFFAKEQRQLAWRNVRVRYAEKTLDGVITEKYVLFFTKRGARHAVKAALEQVLTEKRAEGWTFTQDGDSLHGVGPDKGVSQ